MLQIYSTLTRTKEPFTPIEPGKVRMYVCGMTVYDYCHLGHAMAMVVFDVVVRYLRERGYDVTYVRNITDVDDKIFRRANENKEDFRQLTARFIGAMHEDLDALGVQRPTLEPRATETMDQIVPMIERLMASGYAYLGDNGDVYYDVSKFEGYGKLSGKRPGELRVGARVEVDEAKDDPLDRVLWKAAKPGEASWESPWGPGRPGWDIECAAMSTHHLGANFDIHGGGIDLQFPHHENEIAQAEADTGEHFANVWMHNGHVRIDDEKMSKSLGNFFTVREILTQYPAEVVRYFMIASHYRSPLSYSDHQLDSARSALARLYTALRGLPASGNAPDDDHITRFYAAMDDDFNTPEALAVLFDLAREINRAREESGPRAARLAGLLRRLGGVLGLLQEDPDAFLKGTAAVGDLSHEEIDRLVDERNQARERKDWAEADRIRERLDSNGVVLEDSGEGSIWRRKS